MRPVRGLIALLTPDQPLELQIVGRTLWHAVLVGLGAGALGCLFFAGSELLFTLLIEQLAGYEPLRARGESVWHLGGAGDTRLWMLLF
ncbi:MAG: chloride channel protein, partial [Kofleriaceae bacterium]